LPRAIAVLAVKVEPLRASLANLDRCARRWLLAHLSLC
jgi:hypothetical protein